MALFDLPWRGDSALQQFPKYRFRADFSIHRNLYVGLDFALRHCFEPQREIFRWTYFRKIALSYPLKSWSS
jgi:hypothetical protein